MEKIKHKKYRNTGLIFEMLTRQITSDILEGKDQSAATEILREHFDGSTEISKEMELYRLLMEETFHTEEQAKDFLKEVVKTREKLDFEKLREEKYDVIGDIKDEYPLQEFFKSRVDNYRELASVYKVFKALTEHEKGEYDPSDVVRSKYTIVEQITNEGVDNREGKVENEITEELREQSRDLRLLTQRVMIEKFNQKYGSLLEEQRKLLRKYINNISNTNNLREHINEETEKLKVELSNLRSKIGDEVVDLKVKEAINLLDEIKGKGVVHDDEVSNLLMYYQLREDIQNALEKQKK